MKSFVKYALTATLAVLASPALSADKTVDEVVAVGDTKIEVEVFPLSPGVARFELGPLYAIFIDEVPDGISTEFQADDVSHKGTVYGTKFRKTPYMDQQPCFREVGGKLWCGMYQSMQMSVVIDLGSRRGEVFALIPEVLDARKGHLAWIAHPENAAVQLHCGTIENMASIFAIDKSGTIRVATDDERQAYQRHYCPGGQ